MRRLKTFPALGSVRLPQSAKILAVHPRTDVTQAPALLVSFEETDKTVEQRHFMVARSGETIPPGALYVDSWRVHAVDGSILALFEIGSPVPADLPAEAASHWRVLVDAGFELLPDKSWRSPPDLPAEAVTQAQIIAMVELQEHGYGGLASA